jgi:hypothetical protein
VKESGKISRIDLVVAQTPPHIVLLPGQSAIDELRSPSSETNEVESIGRKASTNVLWVKTMDGDGPWNG